MELPFNNAITHGIVVQPGSVTVVVKGNLTARVLFIESKSADTKRCRRGQAGLREDRNESCKLYCQDHRPDRRPARRLPWILSCDVM